MHNDLIEAGWTEEHWNRITTTITEEAQRARVAAQFLPIVGPVERDTLAIPTFATKVKEKDSDGSPERLIVESDPDLFITRLAVNVYLRSHEMADPGLGAALQMFRRAANYIARSEDLLIFRGRDKETLAAPEQMTKPLKIVHITQGHGAAGIFETAPKQASKASALVPATKDPGEAAFRIIVAAINAVEERGYFGPFACVLGTKLFEDICSPTTGLVLPRDRVLPFLQGPLVRSSAVDDTSGVVIALGGAPVELVVASDIHVRFLQMSPEPRAVFRVSERIALRVKDRQAIQPLEGLPPATAAAKAGAS
jgi:uncharacterized linocin/CFP29 family protein